MNNYNIASFIAYLAVTISCIIRISKIIGLIKFQDVERSNFSPGIIAILSSFIWGYYGISVFSLPLILSSSAGIFLDVIILVITYLIIQKKKLEEEKPNEVKTQV